MSHKLTIRVGAAGVGGQVLLDGQHVSVRRFELHGEAGEGINAVLYLPHVNVDVEVVGEVKKERYIYRRFAGTEDELKDAIKEARKDKKHP